MQMGVSCYFIAGVEYVGVSFVFVLLCCLLFVFAGFLFCVGLLCTFVFGARIGFVFLCVVLLLCWSVVPRSCVGVCFFSATPYLSYETRGSRSECAKIFDRIERKRNKCCLSEARNLKERLRQ